MRLVVTGGGTGGHVYPALEVARLSREAGWEVRYLGSLRGLEAGECPKAGIPFSGFDVGPMLRPWTPAGIRSALVLLKASARARKALAEYGPSAVFSTGGFAAGPVVAAAKAVRVPVVLHEQNAVPGRTNRMARRFASRVCVVFDEAAAWFRGKSVRTGMPVRRELGQAAASVGGREREGVLTLSFGGSQGSAAINEAVLTVALRVGGPDRRWLQVTGPKQFEAFAKAHERTGVPDWVSVKAFLPAADMAEAYGRADVAIARSGSGTVCELALYGIPAVFVPYPYAHADHQFHNAKAIEAIGGGTVLRQTELTPERLEEAWRRWAEDAQARHSAFDALRAWSLPDAGERVMQVVREVAGAPRV